MVKGRPYGSSGTPNSGYIRKYNVYKSVSKKIVRKLKRTDILRPD